ncbi:hypothetical protein RRG08_050616 [Elysia crispata]|uniref:Uncharacterized protein n=1 Tax=Elysia crispata TaxID=231223 RepID=A0AAE1APT3_9GAST|nr:hypothetical protein RRG08_050616 [Elysia crispata]
MTYAECHMFSYTFSYNRCRDSNEGAVKSITGLKQQTTLTGHSLLQSSTPQHGQRTGQTIPTGRAVSGILEARTERRETHSNLGQLEVLECVDIMRKSRWLFSGFALGIL